MRIKTRVQKIIAVLLTASIVAALLPMMLGSDTVLADLPPIQNASISADGSLTWDPFKDAILYSVSVGGFGENCEATTFDLNKICIDNKFPSGEYTVKLYAYNSEYKVISATWTGTFSYTAALPQLSTPTNLSWNGNTLTWDSVPNADYYNVNVLGYPDEYTSAVILKVITVDTNKIDVSEWLYPEGTHNYFCTVVACSNNNYPNSDTATSTETSIAIVLPDLKNVKISSEGILSWDAFNGSYQYQVSVANFGDFCTSTTFDLKQICRNNKFSTGEYVVKVSALDSEGAQITNSWTGSYSYTSSLPQLQTPTNLSFNGKVATWDEVTNADYYNVNLYDGNTILSIESVTTNSIDYSSFISDSGSHSYYFTVVACSKQDYASSETAISTEPSFKVVFNANGHGSAPATQIVKSGKTASKPSDPTASGYTFGGWYTDSACTKAYDFSTSVTSNVTLYAKWTINSYNVSFNSNGGSSIASQTVTEGNKATKPSDPTKSGCTFGGWYTDSACATAYDFNTAVTSNITLYAKWNEIETPKLTSGIAHVQDIGNVTVYADSDGVLTLGTTGQSKRIEEITINFENNTPYSGTLEYRVHVQDKGWMEWVPAGTKCGTEGLSLRIEAIEIRLTGELAEYYSVEYCVHIQDYGDMQGWAKNGECAGTAGRSARLEGIQIVLVPKGSPAPAATYEGITAVTETPFVEGF